VDSSYLHLASLTFDAVALDPILLNRNEAGAKIASLLDQEKLSC
jgi:hypothetical protein